MEFLWGKEKNEILIRTKAISFERIVVAVQEGYLLDIIEHPNKEKYGHQEILIVGIENYAYCAPFVRDDKGNFFLKTIYKSRKYTRDYNLGGKDEKE